MPGAPARPSRSLAARELEDARLAARRRNLLHPLQRVGLDFRDAIRAGLRARGHTLRPAHATVIVHLAVGGSRLTALAERAGVSKQAMGKLVDELEAIGYLERRPDPGDGRAKLVCFSRRGERLLRDSREIVDGIWQDYAALLGETRLRHLQADLERLLALLEATQPPPSPPAGRRR